MENAVKLLAFEPGQLEELRSTFRERIARGLASDGDEVKALSAYLPPPDPDLAGQAVVVDIGGTNLRAALVELEGRGKARIVRGPIKERLPVRDPDIHLTPERFFDLQAELTAQLEPPPGLPVGYCFSYPAEILPNRDGRLLAWTKGIELSGVVGTLVGSALFAALERAGLHPKHVRVLNDTVASMLGGATVFSELEPASFIGLIVGTGTNMSGFFSAAQAPKLKKLLDGVGEQRASAKGATSPRMAINLESGNLDPPHLTSWDDEIDQASDNPGRQRFEKAVSGHYLPYLFERILPDQPGYDPEEGSKTLVDYRDRSLEAKPLAVAGALLARSADLVAAGLAAVVDLYDASGPVGIVAEGSLIWNDPKFAPHVRATLATLLGSDERAKLLRLDDANLFGSACAALGK